MPADVFLQKVEDFLDLKDCSLHIQEKSIHKIYLRRERAMKKYFIILVAIGILAMTSCSGGGGGSSSHSDNNDNPPSPSSVNANGTWKGSYNSTASGPLTNELNIQQNGNKLTGTFFSSDGSAGTLEGTLAANTASFTITILNPDCQGSFNGTGTFDNQSDPETVSFQFDDSTACGGDENGTVIMAKQPSSSENVAGTWYGFFTGLGYMTLDLQQNGKTVTGTGSANIGAKGTLAGSVGDNKTGSAVLTIVEPPYCNGTFDVFSYLNTLTEPQTMILQYDGRTACTGEVSGTGILEKQ